MKIDLYNLLAKRYSENNDKEGVKHQSFPYLLLIICILFSQLLPNAS